MKYLLDTNVISEIRHPKGDPDVKRRIAALDSDSLFTSAIVLGELTKGITRLSEGRRKVELLEWLDEFERDFGDRVLPFSRKTARVWGKMVAAGEERGIRISVSDGQIAATALGEGLVVVTRNVKHFAATGALIWNAWETDA